MTARDYRLAPCTIDTTDYEFNRSYVLATSRKDKRTARKIRDAYLEYTALKIDYYTGLNKRFSVMSRLTSCFCTTAL